MPVVTFIRGLPGSGKTTLAKRFVNTAVVAADDYFTDSDGAYHYDPVRLPDAHQDCQERAAALVNEGRSVVITNTFTRERELNSYREALDLLIDDDVRYSISVIDLFDAGLTDEELAARCVHGVPVEKIALMRARWE